MRLDGFAAFGEDGDAVPALLAVPDRAIARRRDGGLGEALVRRLQLLQAGDVRLCLLEPGEQVGEPAVDAVHVEGGDLHAATMHDRAGKSRGGRPRRDGDHVTAPVKSTIVELRLGRSRMPEDDSNAVTVATNVEVLIAEYRKIWPGKPEVEELEDYHRLVKEHGQAALCLSGGGIRSASFALGVVQALSRAGLLTRFHYLSTVSGGGYTGALLQRWIHEKEKNADAVMMTLSRPEEPEEIKRLRQNSNFITPRVGLGSADTWTAIAISVRNVLLNWLLFVPLVMLAALVPNLFHAAIASFSDIAVDRNDLQMTLLGLAALAIGRATFATVRLLPSYRPRTMRLPPEGDRVLARRIVWPLLIWSVLATLAIAVELLGPTTDKEVKAVLSDTVFRHGSDVAICSLIGMVLGLFLGGMTLKDERSHTFSLNVPVWLGSFLLVSIWIALGAWLFGMVIAERLAEDWEPILLTVLGPLWLLTGTLLGAIVFVGFRGSSGPSVVPDDDREWIARLSAVKLRPMFLWAVLAPSVLLISTLIGEKVPGQELSWTGAVTTISGLIAALGGRSQASGGVLRSAGTFVMRFLPLDALIAVATFVFLIALLILFGTLEALLAGEVAALLPKLPTWLDDRVLAHLTILVVLLVLFVLLGRIISVNRFSLNGLYRNRLARAFLGAARPADKRTPDPFTGFDAGDNVRMSRLDPQGPEGSCPLSGDQCRAERDRDRESRLAGAQGRTLRLHAAALRQRHARRRPAHRRLCGERALRERRT